MIKDEYGKETVNLEAKITVTIPKLVYDWLVEDQGGHEKVMQMVKDAGMATETALILTYELRQESKITPRNTEAAMTDIIGLIDIAAQEATQRICDALDDTDAVINCDPKNEKK
jgi:hypothetical protein